MAQDSKTKVDLNLFCTYCGSANPQDSTFCGQCGKRLFHPPADTETPAFELASNSPSPPSGEDVDPRPTTSNHISLVKKSDWNWVWGLVIFYWIFFAWGDINSPFAVRVHAVGLVVFLGLALSILLGVRWAIRESRKWK